VAEILPVGILRSDAEGRCLFVNRPGCAVLGVDAAEAAGFGWMRTLSPTDRDETRRAWAAATHRAEPLDLELVVRAPGAAPRNVSCRVAPVVDAAGKVTGHLAALQDLAPGRDGPGAVGLAGRGQGDAEDEMRERMAHLTRVSTMGEMAAGIAHEINQPLTAIATYAQACRRLILAGRLDSSDHLETLEKISRQAHRAGEVVRRLRSLGEQRESPRELVGLGDHPDIRNGVIFPSRLGDRYLRLDRPNRELSPGEPASGDAIVLSESTDLVEWHPLGVVMRGRPRYWDERIGAGPPPIRTRQGWLLVYHGVATHFGSVGIYQAGVALLDLEDPVRLLGRSRDNVLEPREMYELVGQVPNVVFPSGMIVEEYDAEGFATEESAVRVYYGAADTSVCMATGTVGGLLAAVHGR